MREHRGRSTNVNQSSLKQKKQARSYRTDEGQLNPAQANPSYIHIAAHSCGGDGCPVFF